jgi:hypothetical protein
MVGPPGHRFSHPSELRITMPDIPDKSTFASLYSGQAPWDIGKPQKAFIDVADQITSPILDAGCGTWRVWRLSLSRAVACS